MFLIQARNALRDAGWPEPDLVGTDTDTARLATARRQLGGGADLRKADALDRATWQQEPPADLVLMNPPWISFGNRQSVALDDARRAMLRKSFPLGFAGFPSAQGPFLELASDLTRDDGVIGVIVPEQVAHLAGYRGAREALLRRHVLRHIERVGEDAFVGVTEPAVILIFGPRESIESSAGVKSGDSVDDWMHAAHDHATAAVGHATPARSTAAIIAAVDRHPTFDTRAPKTFRDLGVHTGGMAKQIIAKVKPDDDADWQPCRRGRDVRLVAIGPPSEWLRVAPPMPPPPGVTPARLRALAVYTSTPVLLRQTADRPIAGLHTTPTYFRNSLLAADGTALGIDSRALCILLGSAAIAFVHRMRWPDARQRTQPQVKIGHLRALPAPDLPHDIANDLAAAAERILAGENLADVEPGVDALMAEWLQLTVAQAAVVREAVEPWSRMVGGTDTRTG